MDRPSEIVLVAALARNRVIGLDGGMPWHLPADLKHFKRVTLGRPVVMGRRTFESIGRPLPGRRNIVLSARWSSAPDGAEIFATLEDALAALGGETVMIIGGGALYEQALPLADRLELTLVDAAPDGDTRFPAWQREDWKLRTMERRPADDANEYALVFCSFVRASAPAI
jgi:dihydrofolate reductase